MKANPVESGAGEMEQFLLCFEIADDAVLLKYSVMVEVQCFFAFCLIRDVVVIRNPRPDLWGINASGGHHLYEIARSASPPPPPKS